LGVAEPVGHGEVELRSAELGTDRPLRRNSRTASRRNANEYGGSTA